MKSRIDFSSRISVRAVIAGIMVSISFMLLSLALMAALGIWNYNLNELSSAGSAFWISATLAWAMSLYCAGLVAALGSRSKNSIKGVLNALAASCGSYLLFGMTFLLFAPGPLDSLLSAANPQFFLRGFLGDVFAFGAGIYGGVVGARFEQHTFHKEARKVAHYST
ncbi:MAG: hypothetical protein Q7U04_02710 [Bacteriovorax sp.]|nr:hypothetical protein [Bacteriovorax sp.]